VWDPNNAEKVVAFMDDTLMLASRKSLAITNTKVKDMMVRRDGGLDWSATHHCEFAVSKFGEMGLTRRREPNPASMQHTRPVQWQPIFLQGIKVAAHKFLGVILDQELRWIGPRDPVRCDRN